MKEDGFPNFEEMRFDHENLRRWILDRLGDLARDDDGPWLRLR